MQAPILPVEGWVGTCASYTVSLLGPVVMDIRDDGPLPVYRVLNAIKRRGIGADVRKASPILNDDDGALRVLHLILEDTDVIQTTPDGDLYVPPDTLSVTSKTTGLTINLPDAQQRQAGIETGYRQNHLREWVRLQPFSSVWRDGIRKHSAEEVEMLAAVIGSIGYVGMPIIRDQNGVIIDGHLRARALVKLGRDPAQHTVEQFFRSDMHRLAFVIAVHYQHGGWPTDLKKEITRFVNKAATRTGVKMNWPSDLFGVVDNQEWPVEQPVVKPSPPPVHRVRPSKPSAEGDQLPQAGSDGTRVMMDMLFHQFPAKVTELGLVDEDTGRYRNSVMLRPINKGWVVRVQGSGADTVLDLTPLGIEIARKVWERDRPMRNVPR